MTIDLLTGKTRPARREDYSTKCSAVAPKDMATPIWDRFIDRVTEGDPDLEAYLQRVAGYCLTGHTKEHVLFFLYGTGANGKSVFVNTLAGIWGDYAITAPIDLFMASHNERHPTELAMLRGARLVTATETTEGRRWDESKIKLLTSVMVVPHRPAVLTAKVLSTIDVLSKGRLIVGCGAGWMREEFEAIEAHDFDRRGAVTNEYIRAFKELWTSDDPTFDGEFTKFSNINFEPKPVQKPHPPIWIGGESPVALRRVARLGDAWYPIGMNPTYPVGTVEQMSESLSRIRAYAEEAGRDPARQEGTYYGWYRSSGCLCRHPGRKLRR